MKVRTWLQRLTDESSLWFNAIKAEDDGDLVSAVSYYLKDAQKSADVKSLIRQALSCSCAAGCLAKMGKTEHANKLYMHAANLYSTHAQRIMASSVREALWSLKEAIENYVLAEEFDSASEARNKLYALSARINPFTSRESGEVNFEIMKQNAKPLKQTTREARFTPELDSEVDAWLNTESSRLDSLISGSASEGEQTFDAAEVTRSLELSGGSTIDEKSIVS